MTAPPDPFAGAARTGIHRIAVPTPFAVGTVNVYLIEDEPLTLVDAGPNSATAFDALERGVGELGHTLEEIELVVLTHQHIDHLGLVGLVASRSGAEVAALDVAVPFVERFSEEWEAGDAFAGGLMLRHGIPADIVSALQSVSRAFRAWGAPATITRVLAHGDHLALRDRSFEVLHRPGHSPTDTVFHDAERRQLIAADHLLATISSNPLIIRPPDGATERPRVLPTYIESLRRTRELDLELVLPGHGDPVTDHRALIDERLSMHRRRAEKLHGLIVERPRTAYELAQSLWGNIAVTQAFLTLSEVLGHADMLLEQGRVAEVERDGITHFEAVGEADSGPRAVGEADSGPRA